MSAEPGAQQTKARTGSFTTPQSPLNALTIDVEDYFQVEAFAGLIDRREWENWPRRVEANTHYLLDRLSASGSQATFFTLGWVADRHPALIRRIVAEGHELASHGYNHERVTCLTPERFRADVDRAKQSLEQTGSVPVIGYRAPTFSVGRSNAWAWRILQETGHRYSSSVFPIRHDLYGDPSAPRTPFRADPGGLWEIPLTTLRLFGCNLPCSGGGYFRLLPYAAYRLGARHLRHEVRSLIFYTHPWELDPAEPPVPGAGRRARFRHRVNRHRMRRRFDSLLRDFHWDRMDRAYASLLVENATDAGVVAAVEGQAP